MGVVRSALCRVLLLIQCINAQLPTVRFQAFRPQGLRVTVSWDKEITFFAFDGRSQLNQFIKGFGLPVTSNEWFFYDSNTTLYINDWIHYTAFVSFENGFQNINQSLLGVPGTTIENQFQVTELEQSDVSIGCKLSRTKLRDETPCEGETIFHDDFDTLNTGIWQIEHYIPMDHPEAPFVSYQRSNLTVYVEGGMLHIQPRLQQNLPGFTNASIISGKLDLSTGCTRPVCTYEAMGDIIPPIASGRVTSAHFAFTYGIVTVRAKLPQGDWLYPEILLESLSGKYGSTDYASGVLKIAMALGNKDVDLLNYSNGYLRGWPLMSAKSGCRSALQFYGKYTRKGNFWGDDFHVFSLKWTPEFIEFSVDGIRYAFYQPGEEGLRSWLSQECRYDMSMLESGGRMAPFDHQFFITLGIAAGGISEFPDTLRSRGAPKPWLNRGRKARYDFWKALSNWYPTWTNSALIIDYIKVDAL